MAVDFIYGVNPAIEVIQAARRKIFCVYVLEDVAETRLRRITALAEKSGVPLERVGKQRLFQMCNTTEHQGVVVETVAYPYTPFDQLQESRRLLLLDNVEDPQNVGAILRSAECFGWQGVLLSDKGVPGVYPSVVKASAGATEYLKICREHSANRYMRELKKAGFLIAALDEDGRVDVTQMTNPFNQPVLLVIGGENRSVGQLILNEADHVLRIPLAGNIKSLNASVAAGMAMYVLSRYVG